MWLLSTDRAELHFFPAPEEVSDGFAALSHVWDKTEQSFQDVRKVQERCAEDGTNPRDVVCEKIRRCCELAESHGYKWAWIDTCCIDKTSSTELSEAINSMFRYYALARICYGYLRDVERPAPDGFDQSWCEGTLVRSIWFQRGWTLQELIAPRFFIFVSKSWEVLWSKADLAEYMEPATRIPAAVLRLEISHTTYRVAQRMSWFRYRKTTRLEDEAYCLLGLFDVHIAPLYGEGSHAFQRLQEEIMRQSVDTTLFAWNSDTDRDPARSCLFAPSPSAFPLNRFAYIPLQHTWRVHHGQQPVWREVEGAHEMSFSVTPHGVSAYIPLIQCKERTYADLFWCSKYELTGCRTGPPGRHLLCLEPDSQAPPGSSRSSKRTSYSVFTGGARHAAVASPKKALRYVVDGKKVRASWKTVLIKHRPPPHRLPGQLLLGDPRAPFIPAAPAQLLLQAPFRFPDEHVQTFMRQCGANRVEVRVLSRFDSEWGMAYLFFGDDWRDSWVIVIRVGKCDHVIDHWQDLAEDLRPPPTGPCVWATVGVVASRVPMSAAETEDNAELPKDGRHVCLEDHVAYWPWSRKRFSLQRGTRFPDEGAEVSLAFTRCPINPGGTLVLEATYHGGSRYSVRDESAECVVMADMKGNRYIGTS